jgi:hypothetical protein
MFRSSAITNAADKKFATVPDTIVHDGITWSKVGLAPNHQAWFFADGQFIVAGEDGGADADATLYAPTDEIDLGVGSRRYIPGGTVDSHEALGQQDARFMAADQVSDAQLRLPATAGIGPAVKVMVAALEADKRLALRIWRGYESIDNALEVARAIRGRAVKAQERLYARVGAPRTPPTIIWQSDLIGDVAGPDLPAEAVFDVTGEMVAEAA